MLDWTWLCLSVDCARCVPFASRCAWMSCEHARPGTASDTCRDARWETDKGESTILYSIYTPLYADWLPWPREVSLHLVLGLT